MKEALKKLWENKTARILLIALIALALLLGCWFVFGKTEDAPTGTYAPTAQEERIGALLSEIEGVERVTVMVTEEDGVPVSAVVIFDGEDGILVRLRITQITANALNLADNRIYVYPSDKK